jgi:hypothetical protein
MPSMNQEPSPQPSAPHEDTRAGMTEEEMRSNVIRLAFGGDPQRFQAFLDVIQRALPPETAAVLRGSSVTGVRWEDGAPFDADGPGTSDLDLTFVGPKILEHFDASGFYIPAVHTKPLSDKDPDIAPPLLPLREQLNKMTGRPVNIQGTRDWIMFVREHLMGQPYLTLIGKVETS